jgi:hypothetical protein
VVNPDPDGRGGHLLTGRLTGNGPAVSVFLPSADGGVVRQGTLETGVDFKPVKIAAQTKIWVKLWPDWMEKFEISNS